MMGHVKEWLIHDILGIRYENLNSITVKPCVPENTTYARGSFYCGLGNIEVCWQTKGDNIKSRGCKCKALRAEGV